MDIIKVFADNVKFYRNQAGFTQEHLAEKSGLHRTYISGIECYRRSIALENIQKIATALKVEPYQLLMKEDR